MDFLSWENCRNFWSLLESKEKYYSGPMSRLLRKYGGNCREIQSHVDELVKMKPIREENAKELEKFADMLEQAVINLQENNRAADLEAGTPMESTKLTTKRIGHARFVVQAMLFGTVKSLRVEVFRKSGLLQRS